MDNTNTTCTFDTAYLTSFERKANQYKQSTRGWRLTILENKYPIHNFTYHPSVESLEKIEKWSEQYKLSKEEALQKRSNKVKSIPAKQLQIIADHIIVAYTQQPSKMKSNYNCISFQSYTT